MKVNAQAVAQIPRPVGGKVNLNAGTLSPTPLPVQRRLDELRRMMMSDPSDFCWRKTPPLLQASRQALADFLGCQADELLLLPNVTFAINLVVSSLTLPRGTEVLISDHDYGAMVTTWQRWAAVRDWNLRTLKLPFPVESAEHIVDAYRQAILPSTRVLFLYHCTSPTGIVMPVREICALARERDVVTVVDGAHAPGMVPLDLADIGADYYGSNTHKWLMGPCPGGFLHVARRRRTDLRALVTSWGWGYQRSEAFEDSGNGGSRWQWDLEFHGTADRTPQMVLPEALAFRTALGGEAAIAASVADLMEHARHEIPLPCRTSPDPRCRAALSVFEVPTPPTHINTVRDRLYHEFGVEAPITSADGKQFLRVSTAVFNTHKDVETLAHAAKLIFT
jgi:isopenicillin-N epimerase